MKILFICKYNAFRSRIAEEYFKKINNDKSIKVISRGMIMDGRADGEQVKIAKELLGINILGKSPEPVEVDELVECDRIFVVADDIPPVMFNYGKAQLKKKITFWKIKDEQKKNKKNIKRIVLAIKRKIEELNKEMLK